MARFCRGKYEKFCEAGIVPAYAHLGCHFSELEIVLRGHTESIGDTVEEGEHGDNVDRLGDLIFAPAVVAQVGNIFGRRAVRRLRNDLRVLHQGALRRCQVSLVDLAFQNCRNRLIIGSLNPQEVSVAVQSIRAAVQIGNVTGDHLLVTPEEMALGEMNGVGEIHHLA
jgi:hypothetical protein